MVNQINSALIDTLRSKIGAQVTRKDIITIATTLKCEFRPLLRRIDLKCGRGLFDLNKLGSDSISEPSEPIIPETDEEIEARLESRFKALVTMSRAAAEGKTRSLIVSGPAGLGKTFEVMKVIQELQPRFQQETDKITGFIRPTGLYKALYEHQMPGQILVFDDADSIFFDDTGLNLLKAACDTTETRYISWRAETKMEDEEGERLPRWFQFEGTIVFITNYDFNHLIAKGNRLAPHFEALMSRSHYLDLEMKAPRDYLIRIRQVMKKGLANLSTKDQEEIYQFLVEHQSKIKDLSLRKVIKIAQIKMLQKNWKELASQLQ